MRRVLYGLIATLAIALAAAGYFRVALLELVLRQGLLYVGFQEPEFRVTAVTLSNIEVTDLRLGAELRLAQLSLDYRPGRLARGQLDRIVIAGLALDLTGPRHAAFDLLTALAASDDGAASSAFMPPPIEVHGATVRWLSPLGPVQLLLDGGIEPATAGSLRGRFDIVAEAQAGRLEGRATLERQVDGGLLARFTVQHGDLVFARAKLVGATAEGEFSMDAAGHPTLAAEAGLAALYLDGEPVAAVSASIRLDGSDLTLESTGTALGAPFELTAQGALDSQGDRLVLGRIVLSAETSHRRPLLTALGLPEFRSGRARLRVAGNATLPLAPMPAAPLEILALLQESGLQGTATLSAEAWSLDGWFDELALVCGLDFEADGGGLAIRLAAPALIEAARLSTAAMADLGLPAALHPLFAEGLALGLEPDIEQGLTLALTAGDSARAALHGALRADLSGGERLSLDGAVNLEAEVWPEWRLSGLAVERLSGRARDIVLAGQTVRSLDIETSVARDGETWSGRGTLASTLEAPGIQLLEAKRVALKLPLAYSVGRERVTLRLSGPGSLEVQEPRLRGKFALPSALRLSLSAGPRPLLTTNLAAPSRYRASLSARSPAPLDLLVAGDTGVLPARLGPFTLDIAANGSGPERTALAAQISVDDFALSAQRLRAEALTIDLELDPAALAGTARYQIERLSYLDPALLLPPAAIAGTATLQDGAASFDLTLSDTEALVKLIATGHYGLDSGRLQGELVLPSTELSGLLPKLRTLHPATETVTGLRGRIVGRADVAWEGSTIDGTAEIVLDDVGIDSEAVTLAGIVGTVALAQLWPPATDRPQQLTIRTVQGPVQVRDITLALRLSPIDGQALGRLHIDRIEGTSDLARLAIDDAELDPGTGAFSWRLRVSELDLSRLFRVADVEGLSGTGVLSGAIPVRYGPGGLVVEPGTLVAAGPGVIRFTSEAAKRALAGGGDQVQLMLRALENFQYDALSLRLEKAAGGAASARLAIRGRNPEVLDGYPFALNIDLSGNFDSLLATVLEAYDLSGQALRATVK